VKGTAAFAIFGFMGSLVLLGGKKKPFFNNNLFQIFRRQLLFYILKNLKRHFKKTYVHKHIKRKYKYIVLGCFYGMTLVFPGGGSSADEKKDGGSGGGGGGSLATVQGPRGSVDIDFNNLVLVNLTLERYERNRKLCWLGGQGRDREGEGERERMRKYEDVSCHCLNNVLFKVNVIFLNLSLYLCILLI